MSNFPLWRSRLGAVVLGSVATLCAAPVAAQQPLPAPDAIKPAPAATPAPAPTPAPAAKPAPALVPKPAEAKPLEKPKPVIVTEGGVVASPEATTAPAAPTAPTEIDERVPTESIDLEGGIGVQRVASAIPGVPMTFRVAFLSQIYSGSDTVRQGDSTTAVTGRLLVQASIIEQLAFNFGLQARNSVNSFGQPQSMLSQGDMHFGVRGQFALQPGFYVGLDGTLYLPTSFEDAGLTGSAISFRPRLLASADLRHFTDNKVPLDIHVNLGYRLDNSGNTFPDGIEPTRIERFAYGVSAYDAVEFGVALEYELPYARPFLAYQMALPVNADDSVSCSAARTSSLPCATDAGFGAAPKWISVGLKAEPVKHLGLYAALDLGLTTKDAAGLPATAPYTVTLGASWTIDPTPKIVEKIVEKEKVVEKEKIVEKMPPLGFINGAIVDQDSKEPIKGAFIEYVGRQESPQGTADKGTFRSYGITPGQEVTLRVTHPDYEPAEVKQTIAEGDQDLSIALKSIPKIGLVKGRVVDQKDKPLKNATVTITGKQTYNLAVDAGGRFQRELPADKYTVAVKADGYLTKGKDIVVKGKDTQNLEIALVKKPRQNLVELRDSKIEIKQKVQFAKGKADLLKQSYPLLNSVAAVLLENPQIKLVRIEGHTDDSGSEALNMELSQARAESVRNYLVQQGISLDRIVAKGFGPSKPLMPNTSKRNRELNRRVEFNIVTQTAKKVPVK